MGDDVHPLDVHGRRVIDCHEQLAGILRNRLGQNHADFFAQPAQAAGSRSIVWSTTLPGEVAGVDALAPDEKRIRHYGLLANRAKRLKLAQARSALDQPPAPPPPAQPESLEAFWLRVAQRDIHRCPHCHAGRMVLIASIHAQLARAPPVPPRA